NKDRGGDRSHRRLDQRRDIVDRKLHRDLIESPDQAKREGERDRQRIERTGLRGVLHGVQLNSDAPATQPRFGATKTGAGMESKPSALSAMGADARNLDHRAFRRKTRGP